MVKLSRKFTFPNGLRVIMTRFGGNPGSIICPVLAVGPIREEAGHRGISHLVEHLVSQRFISGVKRWGRKSAKPIRYSFHPETHLDFTHFSAMFRSPDAIQVYLALMAGFLGQLPVRARELRKAKTDVLREHRMKFSASEKGVLFEALYANAFPGHPYENFTFGRPEDFLNVDEETVARFYKTNYTPANTVLSLAGSLDNAAEILRLIERDFGQSMPPAVANRPLAGATVPHGSAYREVEIRDKTSWLLVGFRVPPLGDKEEALLALLHEAFLSPTADSHRVLRGRNGPAKAIFTFLPMTHYTALYEVLIQIKPGIDPDEAANALFRQAELLSKTGLSSAKLETLRKRTDEWYWGTPAALTLRLAAYEAIGGGFEKFQVEFEENRANLQSAQVAAAAARWLRRENAIIVVGRRNQ